jgi:hypothetical protein
VTPQTSRKSFRPSKLANFAPVAFFSLVAFASGCTSTSNSNPAKPQSDAAQNSAEQPGVETSADGGQRFRVKKSETSSFGAASLLPSGQLVKATFGEVSVYAMVDAGAKLSNANGWKISTRSNDAAWNPDRCSSVQLHETTDYLIWFETTIPTSGTGQASPSNYQLNAFSGTADKSRFLSITPTPTNEVAFPRTLTALANGNVGYLWANGSLALPGLLPEQNGAPGATAPTAIARGGNNAKTKPADQISWRTINTKTWSFVDEVLNVPAGDITGVESDGDSVTFSTALAGFLTVDLTTGEVATSPAPPSSPEVVVDRAALPPEASDIRLLGKSERGSVVQFTQTLDGVSTVIVGALSNGEFSPAPFGTNQRACVISR